MTIISPQWTLLLGIAIASFIPLKVEWQKNAKVWSGKLLQWSVVLLGASLNFHEVIKQGAEGLGITAVSIILVFVLGWLGIKSFKIENKLGWLLTMGTAICGGSAIGALAPVIAADATAIGVSIGIVFMLNALAVYLFPFVGEFFQLTQEQFGLWAALAIHDTSSVVAAGAIYGEKALEVATTVKLTRALWIIPLTLMAGIIVKSNNRRFSIPWFIVAFLLVSVLFTFIDMPSSVKIGTVQVCKLGFALTMFLIGLTCNLQLLKTVGVRPLVFGLLMWIIVSAGSLAWIKL
ncbi:MAG: YeiH family protein [Bacteriovoracia bacterium]